ncbi:hypothetical protein [Streptomyces sp. NPDC048521]|uniref:hypothetical protein n=1 Tax=Streptomyces sp. NPDC048521 TaxID=3365566 RepID=UPI003718194F
MTSATATTTALEPVHRERLTRLAGEVSFDAGARLFGGSARRPKFHAGSVRGMCVEDPAFGRAIAVRVGHALAQRLHA